MSRRVEAEANLGTQTHAAEARAVVRHGDWLLARGTYLGSDIIATVTNDAVSHAAIYDADRNEAIEAIATGMVATPLPEFLRKSHRVMVIRPMWATDRNRPAAVRLARSHLGKGYNYTGLIGLGATGRFYCTQLAIAAYVPYIRSQPDNPLPPVIKPGQMYHWGRIVYDSGPFGQQWE